MRLTYTLVTVFIALSSPILAQIDQVSVGPSYSQQAYYKIATGEVETVPNEAWDIAFSAEGQQDAGVFINESSSLTSASLLVFLSEISDWSAPIIATDELVDSIALYNPEATWTEGAFNTVKDPASPFDYGWGIYNPQNHIIEGSRIFIIKDRQGSFFKFQVVSLASGSYTFRYADLNGDNEKTFELDKANAEGSLIYFSFDTEDEVRMPTDYDLIFQRYSTPLDAGDEMYIPYTVTGVLLAPGVEAVVADGVDPNNVNEADYADQYSGLPTVIGHEWKAFDFSSGWVMDQDRTHFIKDTQGSIFQLTFFDFEGSSTGITTMEKKLVGTVATKEEAPVNSTFTVYPNPTTEYFVVENEHQLPIDIAIVNNKGEVVRTLATSTGVPVEVFSMAAGIYHVSIKSESEFSNQKLVITK